MKHRMWPFWACALAWIIGGALALAQVPAGPSTGSGYPNGSIAFVQSGTGATSATTTVNQSTTQATYICHVTMTEASGTGVSANGTITNVGGTTLQYSELGQIDQSFSPCLLATSPGTGSNSVATTPVSTAATTSSVIISGYRL